MEIQKKLSLAFIPKIYISPQHGAIITLVGVNFIGILHSNTTALFQIFAFIFGFSTFHTAEILLLNKHAFQKLKNYAFGYGIIALTSGLLLIMQHPHIVIFALGLTILSALFLILHNLSNQKSLFHLISFALLIWLGLGSVNTNNEYLIFNLFVQTFLYFAFTVAIIHWRLGKIKIRQLTYLIILEIFLCMFFINWKGIGLLATILTIKAIVFLLNQNYWKKSSLKLIGYEETISLIIYILLMSS